MTVMAPLVAPQSYHHHVKARETLEKFPFGAVFSGQHIDNRGDRGVGQEVLSL
jgi:hypothetical protein